MMMTKLSAAMPALASQNDLLDARAASIGNGRGSNLNQSSFSIDQLNLCQVSPDILKQSLYLYATPTFFLTTKPSSL